MWPKKKKKKKNWISPGEDRTPDLRIPQHNTAYKYDALTDWATGESRLAHWRKPFLFRN